MRATLSHLGSKKSASSSRWLTRQLSDPFVRSRTPSSPSSTNNPNPTQTIYRSRASHKLLSLSEKYPQLLPKQGVVVDLGCAPGGWAQVAGKKVGRMGRVVGVDLLPVRELGGGYENVLILQGDFLAPETQAKLSQALASEAGDAARHGGADIDFKVDTVLSDMMANMTGIRIRDVENSLELCGMALSFARKYLKVDDRTLEVEEEEKLRRKEDEGGAEGEVAVSVVKGKKRLTYPGGSLLLKHFAHPDFSLFRKSELEPRFHKVHYVKPEASRRESSEGYFVCLGYRGG